MEGATAPFTHFLALTSLTLTSLLTLPPWNSWETTWRAAHHHGSVEGEVLRAPWPAIVWRMILKRGRRAPRNRPSPSRRRPEVTPHHWPRALAHGSLIYRPLRWRHLRPDRLDWKHPRIWKPNRHLAERRFDSVDVPAEGQAQYRRIAEILAAGKRAVPGGGNFDPLVLFPRHPGACFRLTYSVPAGKDRSKTYQSS